jgi:hypothetical protein
MPTETLDRVRENCRHTVAQFVPEESILFDAIWEDFTERKVPLNRALHEDRSLAAGGGFLSDPVVTTILVPIFIEIVKRTLVPEVEAIYRRLRTELQTRPEEQLRAIAQYIAVTLAWLTL